MTDSQTTVLHVDDDPGFLELTETFVSRFAPRFDYRTSTDPFEVPQLLEDGEIECLVSDYEMPGRDGISLLERIQSTFPSLPFVLFTGKGSEEIASEAISAGVTDYLQKSTDPGQFELLVHGIGNAVEQARNERRIRQVYDAIHQVDEGVSLVDEDGRFVYVNRSYAEAFGYDPSEMVGMSWRVLYRNEAEADVVDSEVMSELTVENSWHGKTLHPRRDGTLFYADHHLGRSAEGLVVCRVTDLGDAPDVPEGRSPIVSEGLPESGA